MSSNQILVKDIQCLLLRSKHYQHFVPRYSQSIFLYILPSEWESKFLTRVWSNITCNFKGLWLQGTLLFHAPCSQGPKHSDRMIQRTSAILTEVAGESYGAENVNNTIFPYFPQFPRDDVFMLMLLCIILIIWWGLHIEISWKYRQLKHSYQIWTVAPLTREGVTTTTPTFTNAEHTDMHFMCGFCDRNFLSVLTSFVSVFGLEATFLMYLKWCILISEKHAVSCHMHMLAMADAKCKLTPLEGHNENPLWLCTAHSANWQVPT